MPEDPLRWLTPRQLARALLTEVDVVVWRAPKGSRHPGWHGIHLSERASATWTGDARFLWPTLNGARYISSFKYVEIWISITEKAKLMVIRRPKRALY